MNGGTQVQTPVDFHIKDGIFTCPQWEYRSDQATFFGHHVHVTVWDTTTHDDIGCIWEDGHIIEPIVWFDFPNRWTVGVQVVDGADSRAHRVIIIALDQEGLAQGHTHSEYGPATAPQVYATLCEVLARPDYREES